METDKKNNFHRAENLIKQLNKNENIETKENPTVTEVITRLQELQNDKQAYQHTKLIKETIGLLNKNQNINELDDY